jgi:hypothetical protein
MALPALLTVITLHLAAPAAVADAWDIYSNNAWGSRGGFHLHAARPARAGALALTVAELYARQSDLLAAGDSDVLSTLRVGGLWSPLDGVELGLRAVSVVNKYAGGLGVNTQLQGNPSLLLKYSTPMTDAWGLGGLAILHVPTSPSGDGLAGGALSVDVEALATFRAHPHVDLSANVGYIFDNSSALFSPSGLSAVNRFAYGISSAHHRAAYGLAATAAVVPTAALGVSPFVELWGQYAGNVSFADNPLALTLGTKIFPAAGRWGEVTVGTDVRVRGAPSGVLPGLPSWRSFVQIAMHFGEALRDEAEASPPPADRVASGAEITAHVAPACPPPAAPVPPRMLAIGGRVTDARWGEALEGARVYVTGQRGATAVDPNSGEFVLCPITAGAGVVQVRAEASGHQSEDQVVPRSELAEATPLTFALRRSDAAKTGRLQGSVLDAKTGQTIGDAAINVPAAQLSLTPEPDGSFRATLQVGRYEARVSAPNYETQKKIMNIQLDEVTIWNVDLRPKRAADADHGKR